MNKSAFSLIISSVMMLTACAGQKPGGEVVTYYPKPVDQNGVFIAQKPITLFDLGRTMSHNSVDIFDPSAPTFAIPPDAPEAKNPLASFPTNPYLLIKDDDVTVFSLFSTDAPSSEILPATLNGPVVAPPVPLTNDEIPLPP